MTLVERKKRQWAQEKAEMEELCGPWGLPPPAFSLVHTQGRSRYASTLEIRKTCPVSAQQDLLPRRQRSPSLPPILGNQECLIDNTTTEETDQPHIVNDCKAHPPEERQEKIGRYPTEDGEGETSGYASDSAPQSSPELWHSKSNKKRIMIPMGDRLNQFKSQTTDFQNRPPISAWQYNSAARCPEQEKSDAASVRSANSAKRRVHEIQQQQEQERLRWGDRGVAAGRLWEPQDSDSRLPQQMQQRGTPLWVERGLNMIKMSETHIAAEQREEHRSESNISGCNTDRGTYLLGQNAPLEPNIKAERESRRVKALELQAAIIQQLEDRERQKKEEKERQLKEEREEEHRFKRHKELERLRLEEEKRLAEEKRQREQNRAQALKLALEKAEQQAKSEKESKKNKKLQESFDAMSLYSEGDADIHRIENTQTNNIINKAFVNSNDIQFDSSICREQQYGLRDNNNVMFNNPQCLSKAGSMRSDSTSERPSSKGSIFKHLPSNCVDANVDLPTHSDTQVTQDNQAMNLIIEAPMGLVQIPMNHDYFTPVHYGHGNGVQMAILMPQHGLYPCIHQPMNMQTLYASQIPMHNQNNLYQRQTDQIDCFGNENKMLTPSKYRQPDNRDASTQTDDNHEQAISQRKYDSDSSLFNKNKGLQDTFDQNIISVSEEKNNVIPIKKDKKYQFDDRYNKELERRPKWGVNKPPMQYKKQSEKDIFYSQKRKLRLRRRAEEKNYTSHSSDDNRSPSPVAAEIKQFPKDRQDRHRSTLSENHWRKKEMKAKNKFNQENSMVETTQISSLECDRSGVLHIRNNHIYQDKNKKYYENDVTPTCGLTLSQKFMNDKYGNPKLWNNSQEHIEDTDKRHFKRHKDKESINKNNRNDKPENRKKYFDALNQARKEQIDNFSDVESNQPIILNQLKSLRDSLKKQQQIWGKYDRENRSSPKNEVDFEME